MTATVAVAPSAPARGDGPAPRISALGLLRSEWTKLWSVRSLWITLAAGFALTIGLSTFLIVDASVLAGDDAGDIPFGFTSIYPVGMIVLIVVGILSITNEYSTGSIRTTMVAAPRRSGVLVAKAVVVTGVTLALAVVTSVLLYVVLQIAGTVPAATGVSLFDPRMLWGVLGATLTLPFGALFGLILGALIRNAAAAISIYFGVFQLGPQILPVFLPDGWSSVTDYMPSAALSVLRSGGLSAEPYGAGVAAIVLAMWLIVLGGIAWWQLKRRDV